MLQGVADDFWSLVQAEFVDTGMFREQPEWSLGELAKWARGMRTAGLGTAVPGPAALQWSIRGEKLDFF